MRFADRFVLSPGPASADQQADLDEHFSPGEQTELALGLGLFHGFSKMLILLGLEPAEMDTTVLPTPPLPTDAAPAWSDDAHSALLAACPDLAARWAHLFAALGDDPPVQPAVLEAVRARMAQLIGATDFTAAAVVADPATPPELLRAAIGMGELFVIDVRAVTDADVADLTECVGSAGVVHLATAMAVWDGIYRVAVTSPAPAAA